MSGQMLVVVALAAASATLLAYGVLSIFFAEERRVSKALRNLPAYDAREAKSAEPLLASFRERAVEPAIESIASLVRRVSPKGTRDQLAARLASAGMAGHADTDRFVMSKIAAAGAALLVLTIVGLTGVLSPGVAVAAAIVGAAVAYFTPDLILSRRISRRQAAIRRELPDVLDMLTISVQAGLGFDGALAKLVRAGKGPLMDEFAQMLAEVQAGVARRDAMRAMAQRANVSELGTFISAMVQAEVFGISISTVLRNQASEMRLRRRQAAEEMGQKAPVKLVFPVMLCILPATLLVVGGPAVVSIARAFGYRG